MLILNGFYVTMYRKSYIKTTVMNIFTDSFFSFFLYIYFYSGKEKGKVLRF